MSLTSGVASSEAGPSRFVLGERIQRIQSACSDSQIRLAGTDASPTTCGNEVRSAATGARNASASAKDRQTPRFVPPVKKQGRIVNRLYLANDAW
jgi:hypothetical protein